MKILLLDIETAPNLVHVWGLWKQNVAINQIIDSGYVLCWAAKWYGEKEVYFDSVYHSLPDEMLKGIYRLMNEADVIVHYNGSKFDIPILNKEFLLYNFLPPSPYKQIDLLTTTRNQFKFSSNKLDYIAKQLNIGQKTTHRGHQLWIDCMNYKPSAWKEMQEYNTNDVILLEKVYDRLKPWIKSHPNHGLHSNAGESAFICPKCGSNNIERRGFAYTAGGKYQRILCRNCGGWSRSTHRVGGSTREERLTNV